MKHIIKTGCDKKYFFNRNALDSFQLQLDHNKPLMMLPYFEHSSLLSSTHHFSSHCDLHLCYLLLFYLQYLTRIFIYHPTSSGSNTTIRTIIFQSTLSPISFPLALALAFFSFSFFSLLNSAWLVSSIDENKIHILIYTLGGPPLLLSPFIPLTLPLTCQAVTTPTLQFEERRPALPAICFILDGSHQFATDFPSFFTAV